MLKLVLENVTFTSRAAEAPRVFATESAHAAALMKDRVFTLLGSLGEEGNFNYGNFLNRNQKTLVRQYMNTVKQKLADKDIVVENGLLGEISAVTKHVDLSGAPRSPAELAGVGALILVIMGRTVMVYQILSVFEALMLNSKFSKLYYYALESIYSSSQDSDDLVNYLEYTAQMAGHVEPSYKVIALETAVVGTEDEFEALARAYAITRVFGMSE